MKNTKSRIFLISLTLVLCLTLVSAVSANPEGIPEDATALSSTGKFAEPPEEVLLVPPYEDPNIIENVVVDNTINYIVIGIMGVASGICIMLVFRKKDGRKIAKSVFIIAAFAASLFSSVAMNSPLAYAADNDFGNPLDTSGIGLFCYYNYTDTGFTLNTTVPAFINFTNYGNYYDGFLSSVVKCRVRADGWIMVWFDNSTDKDYIPYAYHSSGGLTANTTGLSVEIQTVFTAAGLTPPDHDEYSYYDYEYPSTSKLILLASEWDDPFDMYFNIPATETVLYSYYSYYQSTYGYFAINGITIVPDGAAGWYSGNLTDYIVANGTTYFVYGNPSSGYNGEATIILWLD